MDEQQKLQKAPERVSVSKVKIFSGDSEKVADQYYKWANNGSTKYIRSSHTDVSTSAGIDIFYLTILYDTIVELEEVEDGSN